MGTYEKLCNLALGMVMFGIGWYIPTPHSNLGIALILFGVLLQGVNYTLFYRPSLLPEVPLAEESEEYLKVSEQYLAALNVYRVAFESYYEAVKNEEDHTEAFQAATVAHEEAERLRQLSVEMYINLRNLRGLPYDAPDYGRPMG